MKDKGTLIGILLGLGLIVLAGFMEGSNPIGWYVPTSIIIVFGGTIGATMASGLMKDTTGALKLFKAALIAKVHVSTEVVPQLVSFAEIARRDGLLALEEAAKGIDDPFLKKGVQLAIDGTDPEEIQDILETEIHAMKARHKAGAKWFGDAGAFAPTIGICGAIIALIHVMENLDDPSKAGPGIAVAFTASLLAVMYANIVFLPIANKLKRISEIEVQHMEMVVEGVLAIQSGANPRIVQEKLLSYLPPKAREAIQESQAKAA